MRVYVFSVHYKYWVFLVRQMAKGLREWNILLRWPITPRVISNFNNFAKMFALIIKVIEHHCSMV